MPRGRKMDRHARAAWGSDAVYDGVPKSVFALMCWHFANAASGKAGEHGAAEAAFFAEWDTLLDGGFTLPKPTNKVKARARKAIT